MSEVTISLDNLTEEQKTVLRLEEKNKPYRVTEDGEPFWYITDSGYTQYGCFSYGIPEHRFYLEIGNCFRTEAEAEEAVIKLKMQTKWKGLSLEAGEADNPWDGEHEHWAVCLNSGSNKDTLHYWVNEYVNTGTTYFPSKKSLNSAIAELGEENVKKYILGVEK